ncbi:MAG: hypothetical protein M1527_04780 [Gammaproteobacteria bacterium]|nr:hypothetical protein [Gammaproteobacteria bacterium]
MDLKIITASLIEAEVITRTISQKLAEATARRDGLLAEVQGIDAAIEGAELAHASALAAVELGDADNTATTAAALDDARESASRKPELIQQRRTADAVMDGLTRRHADAHGRYVALLEQHKAEQTEVILERCRQAMDAARAGVAELRNRIAEAQAARRVLEGLDAGHRWTFGMLDITEFTFNTDTAAVSLIADSLRRELQAA